jgi:hypothetical protein
LRQPIATVNAGRRRVAKIVPSRRHFELQLAYADD